MHTYICLIVYKILLFFVKKAKKYLLGLQS